MNRTEGDAEPPTLQCVDTVRFSEATIQWQHVGPPTQGLVAADMDGDGLLDLVATLDLGDVVVMRNRGGGHAALVRAFEAPVRVDNRAGAGIVVTDWNGDGRPDIVGATRGGRLTLYENRSEPGSLAFERIGETTAPHDTEELALADMTGDGRDEIIAYGSGTTIWAVREDGTLEEPSTELELYGRRGAVGDLDGDGRPDIVLPVWGRDSLVTVGVGDGRGGIDRVRMVDGPTLGAMEVALGDVDADGVVDVVVVGHTWPDDTLDILGREPRLVWMRGIGGGELDEAVTVELLPGHLGWSVRLEDLDDDGVVEIVAFAGGLLHYENEHDLDPTEIPGAFHFFSHDAGMLRRFEPGVIEAGLAKGRFLVADLDEDGLEDIAHATGSLTVYWGCES